MALPTAACSLFRSALRTPLRSAARNVVSKPPKEKLTLMHNIIGATVLFSVIFVPSGWFVAHIEDYKKGH